MELRIVLEAGHTEAITGMKFSFQTECPLKLIKEATLVTKGAKNLAKLDGGHNKFLESIMVWVDIRASLKVWKQLDTYRIGLTKQSKSTMHTIMRKELAQEDFDAYVNKHILLDLNDKISNGDFDGVCNDLPSSFLQTRRVCLSYKVIRHIIQQRKNHKLPEWQEICNFFEKNLKYPDLLGLEKTNDPSVSAKD